MAKFLLAYHGGEKPETEAAMQDIMAKWGAWMEANGSAMVDPGNPVGMSKTVTASGVEDHGGANPLSGYSVVEAATMDAALEISKGCPHLEMGTIEIAEILSM